MHELELTEGGARALPARPRRCVVLADVRRVLVDGNEARLGGRAFDLLLALHARHGQVVPKQDLHDAIWPGLAVMPNNLDVQVWALRRCLGPEAISTVARRGYALTAAVDITVVGEGHSPMPSLAPALPASTPDPVQQQARMLVQQLAASGRLLLTGGDEVSRVQWCDAVCQAYARSVQGRVWRLDARDGRDLHQLESRVVRLQRVGGLVVFVEAEPAMRRSLYAWARAATGVRSLSVLATAAMPDTGADAGVHVATAPPGIAAPVPSDSIRRALRWYPRRAAGIG